MLARRLALLAMSALAAAAASAAGDRTTVGSVSLVIGDARVMRSDGSQTQLRQGSEVMVGDRVETGANGHVHLRFVDRGAVSVRPGSVLEVQSYRFDPAHPEANEVRLRVEQGTARSISGAATEIDKSRFRLNTPIAAIGVRGTDFIAQVTPREVRAVVAQGAITVAPLGAGCSAVALGPCGGAGARDLSAEMGRLMVEVRSSDRVAQLAPATGSLLSPINVADSARDRNGAEMVARVAALVASLPPLDLKARAADRAVSDGVLSANASATSGALFANAQTNDRTAIDVLANVPVGKVDTRELNTPPDPNAQLVWGRWSIFRQGPDNLSVSFGDAAKDRSITVGDLNAGLFRSGGPDQTLTTPESGRVDLRLNRAFASFEINGRTDAASVEGGTLSLDFGQKTFATALAMSSASTGRVELRTSGQVQENGIFTSRDADQRVAGAISLDGKEAGYLFERISGGGVFRGRTLWGGK